MYRNFCNNLTGLILCLLNLRILKIGVVYNVTVFSYFMILIIFVLYFIKALDFDRLRGRHGFSSPDSLRNTAFDLVSLENVSPAIAPSQNIKFFFKSVSFPSLYK